MFAKLSAAFPARVGDDRSAVLTLVLIDSVCVVAGFVTDSFFHIRDHGLDYPWIVHVHALTFSSWLVLFNAQVWLVRKRRIDLHQRLGKAMFWVACAMIVIGPATAIIVDGQIAPPGTPPVFLIVQFTDIIAFASLTFTAISQRKDAATHKRLMLMGLFYLSDAGFARLVNPILALPLGDSALAQPVGLYAGTNLMALALGVYDLTKYRRLHPAYLAALAWIIILQSSALFMLTDATWTAAVRRIYGM